MRRMPACLTPVSVLAALLAASHQHTHANVSSSQHTSDASARGGMLTAIHMCLAAQAHGVTAGAWVCGRDAQADAQPHVRTGQAQGPHGRAVVRRVMVSWV